MPSFGIFKLKLSKTILISEIITLKFGNFDIFAKKQKWLNSRSKTLSLGVFALKLKKLFPYLKSAPSNLYISKILGKNKNS